MRSPKTPRQLLSATEEEPNLAQVTKRYPLAYTPSSTTLVNTSRLPPPAALQGMGLSFREEPRSEHQLEQAVQLHIFLFAVSAALGAFLIQFIGPVIPFAVTFIVALLLAVGIAAAFIFFPSKRNTQHILLAFFLPPTVVIGSYLLSPVLSNRPIGSFLFGGVAIIFILLTPSRYHPAYFYREWIFSAPHLRPETRQQRPHLPSSHILTTISARARWLTRYGVHLGVSLAILFLLLVVGAYSPSVAMVCLFLAALAFMDFRPLHTYQMARRLLSHYLTYGANASGAPGVWIPETTLQQRRRAIILTVFLFYLSLSTGLCLYFPADLITIEKQIELEDDRQEKAAAEKAKYIRRRPELVQQVVRNYYSLEKALAPYRNQDGQTSFSALLRFMVERNARTHEGLNTFFSSLWRTWQVSTANLFLFLILPFGIAITLPNLLILGLCRGILLQGEELRLKVEGYQKGALEKWISSIKRFLENLYRRLKGNPLLEKSDEWVSGVDDDGRTEWQWCVDRLTTSLHAARDPAGSVVREAEHLFLGIEPALKFPILLDRKILAEHCYIVGHTGSGKTSLGMMPLLIQLMRGHSLLVRQGQRVQRVHSSPVPIVIIDLKGDPALFHTAREEAKARGQEFRFFTPEQGKVSHYFNPFRGFASESRSFIQLVQLFLDSLSLNHGEGYGRSYYTRRNRQAIYEALNHPSKPRTFPALKDVMAEIVHRQENKDAYEVFSTIFALAEYKNLVTTDVQENTAPDTIINMATAIEKNQVIYFWLPSAVESVTTREIGKLALFALLSAAIDRQLERPQEPTRQVYLFIDEFQRIAGENFKIILQQARSFGLSAILANQTISDLNLPGEDLRPTIRTNTRVQLHFTVNDPHDMATLSKLSGEEVRLNKSWGQTENLLKFFMRRSTKSEQWSESLKSRLTIDDISSVSDHPQEFIAHISRGNGYTQFAGLPFRVRTGWPIPAEVYERRRTAPWPSENDFPVGTVVQNLKSPKEIEAEARLELFNKQQAILRQVIEEAKSTEEPKPIEESKSTEEPKS